jgi:hypothetical protein
MGAELTPPVWPEAKQDFGFRQQSRQARRRPLSAPEPNGAEHFGTSMSRQIDRSPVVNGAKVTER